MKILWICNVPNKDVYAYKGILAGTSGGWLTGLSEGFKKEKSIDLVYCYPLKDKEDQDDFFVEGIHYYSFYSQSSYKFLNRLGIDTPPLNKRLEEQNRQLKCILNKENPDIIHIFGTEFYHSLLAVEIGLGRSQIVCSIQGLTSIISDHYLSLLPRNIYKKINISCLFRGTLLTQKKNLKRRGEIEKTILSRCSNIIGRTDWDKACTYFLNRERRYYCCNETLREVFYHSLWDFNKIEKYSIFMSQGSSPIKGLNILLEAVNYLKKDYPEIKLRIGGNDFIKTKTFKDKIKLSTYGAYIKKLINRFELSENVYFVGPLNEKQMVAELIKTNVFVSPSSIENSSNSIGEAMLLGVPVISSDVGGIKSLMTHNEEGLIYQADAPYMLAYNIKKIFDDDILCRKISKNGRTKALETHNPEKNARRLLEIYYDILINAENKNVF